MKRIVNIIALLLIFVFAINAHAQTEFVFVHLNKNQAVTGDVVEYSAYLLTSDNKPSTTIYFQLVNPEKQVVLRWWQKIEKGKCAGQFIVPNNLPTGVFQLFAYTYMCVNQDDKYKFHTPLIITNYDNQSTAYLRYSPDYVNNTLVSVLQDIKGDSAIVECQLYNNLNCDNLELQIVENDRIIARQNVDYEGLTSLAYLPEKGNKYDLVLYQRCGIERRVSLPNAYEPNILLSNFADVIECKIVQPINSNAAQQLNFEILNNDKVLIDTILASNSEILRIAKKRLKVGVNQFVVKCVNSEQSSSCAYYLPKFSSQTTDTIQYADKVNITLPQVLTDSLQSASVSVMANNLLLQKVPPANIEDFLALTAKTGLSAAFSLSEKPILGNSIKFEPEPFVNNYKELSFNIIEGVVRDTETKVPFDSVLIIASYTDNSANFEQTFTNSKGEFLFVIDSLWDDRPIVLQIVGNEYVGKKAEWVLKSAKNTNSKSEIATADSVLLDSRFLNVFNNIRKRSLVNRVLYKNEITPTKPSADSIPSFYNIPDKVIYPADYAEFSNFSDICANIVPSVKMEYDRRRGYRFNIVITETQMVAKENVLILLNGVPFSNLAYIALLSSAQVKRIDVFNSVFMYGHLKYNGAIAIYTYNQDITAADFNNPAYIYSNKTNSVSATRLLKYDKTPPTTDLCVYWNADFDASVLHNIQLENLQKGDYRLMINGITKSGQPLSLVKNIVIK